MGTGSTVMHRLSLATVVITLLPTTRHLRERCRSSFIPIHTSRHHARDHRCLLHIRTGLAETLRRKRRILLRRRWVVGRLVAERYPWPSSRQTASVLHHIRVHRQMCGRADNILL